MNPIKKRRSKKRLFFYLPIIGKRPVSQRLQFQSRVPLLLKIPHTKFRHKKEQSVLSSAWRLIPNRLAHGKTKWCADTSVPCTAPPLQQRAGKPRSFRITGRHYPNKSCELHVQKGCQLLQSLHIDECQYHSNYSFAAPYHHHLYPTDIPAIKGTSHSLSGPNKPSSTLGWRLRA